MRIVTALIGMLVGMWLMSPSAKAAEVHVAVAANFLEPVKALVKLFEQNTEHRVKLSVGSTGKLYAQITHGAPFEVLLAADIKRPKLLIEADQLAVADSLFTYALGRLVLWSAQPAFVDKAGQVLKQGNYNYIALATPKTAPYGAAAMQVLQRYSDLGTYQGKVVTGTSVTNVFQYIATGNAELGFIALSQYKAKAADKGGSYWIVNNDLYDPIEQGAVLLKQGKDNPAAVAFLALLRSEQGLKLIEEYGYGVPN